MIIGTKCSGLASVKTWNQNSKCEQLKEWNQISKCETRWNVVL